MTLVDKPRPGSPEARALGCCCPVLDNAMGRGRGSDGERFGWWVNKACPVHARPAPEGDSP